MLKKIEAEDLKFIEKNIDLLMQGEITLEEIVSKTTSPALLHAIAVLINEAEGNEEILGKLLENPYCEAETIVYVQENNYDCKWVDKIIFHEFEESYSKEKLLEIAMADKYSNCSIGIIACKNCDEEIFYRIYECCKNSASEMSKYYNETFGSICAMALVKRYTLRQAIIEEVLDNFLNTEDEGLVVEVVRNCNEEYLDKVMSKIEENECEKFCNIARAIYKERKGSK